MQLLKKLNNIQEKAMTVKRKLSQSAFAVICAPILYNVELTDAEKIIYGHISNLSNEYGYCYATNAYLAELTRVLDKQFA